MTRNGKKQSCFSEVVKHSLTYRLRALIHQLWGRCKTDVGTAIQTAGSWIILGWLCKEKTISKKEKKARTALINNFQKGLSTLSTVRQRIVMMNQTHPSYGHSEAFNKAERLHLLTSSLFKAVCFCGSRLDTGFSAACVIWKATSAAVLQDDFCVTWYFTKFSQKNVWEFFKMRDSSQGKQRLALQRGKCHMAQHILSLFPEAKEVARGRKLTIIILPRNWQHT